MVKRGTVNKIRRAGHRLIERTQDIGLGIVALATVVAIGFEVKVMFEARAVSLADLLLLFIYLEVLTMVSIYIEMGKLPIRIPLYIAIVALARYMILDMKNMDTLRLMGAAGAILLIAFSVLVIRYGHIKLPYEEADDL